MMMLIEPKVLKGFRDFLPEKEIKRKKIINILEKTFVKFGFQPIDTPVLEYRDVLLGKGGGETDKQLYSFKDNGKRDVAMRFDLTIPFARFMAAHLNELVLPFKRFHIDKVWRGENTQRGRYREFIQCDFDIVGVDNSSADFEILQLMHQSFKAMGVKNISFKLSHRGIFNNFLKEIEASDQSEAIMRIVDKIGKIGKEKVLNSLKELISSDSAIKILDYIEPESNFTDTLVKITALSGGKSEETERLSDIYNYLKETGIEDLFILDPSITRGLDYYTGIVYETFLKDLPDLGSVCSGGRYNNLASLYTKKELPGVGSSIGLDRLMAGLEELGVLNKKTKGTDVLILNIESSSVAHNHFLASVVRESNLSCEVYLENKKLGNQFSFAEKKGIEFAIICGKEEQELNIVNLKNISTRENLNKISIEEAIKIIIKTMGQASNV
ncbi:MAG: histidine--tRNA ligase [Spirochaetales bacterium]|nr:histidine--tRNA ligase [Spirochaetales bacterium]